MINQTGIPAVYNENQRKTSTRTAQPIDPITLGVLAGDIYASNPQNDFFISHLWVANVTGSDQTFNIYFVPSGGTSGLDNAAIFQQTIPANTSEPIAVAIGHRIAAGAKIQALASSVDAVNIGGWGYDQGSEE